MRHPVEDARDLLTVDAVHAEARRRLPREVYDYASGGAGEERTLRRNREILERIFLRPRLMRDVDERSTATSFLGVPLSLPVLFAPVGSIAIFDDGGAATVARAAHAAGTASFVPTIARPSLEDVAARSDGPLFFQSYVRGDERWVDDLVARVEEAGYRGIAVTVDLDVDARRERDILNRFSRTALHGVSPNLGAPVEDWGHAGRWTWSDFDRLRRRTSLPLMLKGVMTPEDAKRSLEHGADAVYVSNHGGRALDYLPSTLEVLGAIREAVGERVEIVTDGGMLHGADVVKALALGANAVLIGKLQVWALAAAGQTGLERVLEILRQEMSIAMGLLGVTEVAALDRSCLAWDGRPV
jgi:isopentenyl diphosphate isomerase/L-lactate dehydrogenase-like FMN-dependent dehydrogenase